MYAGVYNTKPFFFFEVNEPVVKTQVETKVLGVPLDNIQSKISSAHLTVSDGSIPSACIIFQTFRFEICPVCLSQ